MIQVGDVLANEYETYLVKALNKERTHAILKCVSDDSIPEESYPITSLDTKGSAFMECDLGNTYNEISFLAHDWFIKYEQQKQRADYLEKYIKIMRDNYSEINKDAQTILRTAPDDVLLKAQIRWNNDVIKILDKILEDDND